MSNIGVNRIDSLLSQAVSSTSGSKADMGVQSFDETFNSLRNSGGEKNNVTGKNDSMKAEDNGFEADTKKLSSSGKKTPIKQDDEPTEEQLAAMSDEVAKQVKEAIQQQFDISEEELSSVMDSLGITDENLLDVSSLTQIVMKLDGVESQADILTNPDFAQDLKDVLASLEEIKTNVSENMADMVDTSEKQEDVITVETEILPDADVETVQPDETDVQPEENVQQVAADTEMAVNEEGTGVAADKKDSDGMLGNDDNMTDKNLTDDVQNNHLVQPQDFAARLTEDLSERVGEKQATEIVRQVVEQVQLQVKQGATSMEMQLYPEHLGKVLVQVVSKDGAITAQITAETEAAKHALESQLTILKENLNNQGVKIENVEVTIASHAFEQNMQGERQHEEKSGSGSRGRRAIRFPEEDAVNDFGEEAEVMEARGNTVSYLA